MKKILSINGGYKFAHSGGGLNKLFAATDKEFFTAENGFEFKSTEVIEAYNDDEEVDKLLWADAVIYHFPAWWMGMPYALKEYFDRVFTAGHRKGMYYSDGRKQETPDLNYGKGGLMHGRKYLVTTTWNAPEAAFTFEDEFFDQRSVDNGVLFGFHKMHAFVGMAPLTSMHFHDVEKNNSPERVAQFVTDYKEHLQTLFNSQHND